VWNYLGDPAYYYEPFAGGLAVLLARPRPGQYEFVGDTDGLITNFWRAAKADPDLVSEWADEPPNSIDRVARLGYFQQNLPWLVARLGADPHFYDVKLAGWYAWWQSCAIYGDCKTVSIRLDRPNGIFRERVRGNLHAYLRQLSARLSNVVIYHGHWDRLARCALRNRDRDTAVFLDPPYTAASGRQPGIYRSDSHAVGRYVHRWAVAAAKLGVKVALCGYAGEYEIPASWTEHVWTSMLGRGRGRERIWFSP